MTADEDTEPLRVPGADWGSAGRDAPSGEPNPSPGSPKDRWHTRTYEFASAEMALAYVAAVVALAVVAGWWPRVELRASRVRLVRSPEPDGRGEREPSVEPAWATWAERLGGRRISDQDLELSMTQEVER